MNGARPHFQDGRRRAFVKITVSAGGLLALLQVELLEDRLASLSAEFLGRFSVME